MPIPKLAVSVALMAVQVGLGMTRKIKGPRLEDLSVSLADYGTPIPRFWGKRRLNPQIIWGDKLHEKKKTSKTKGGKYTEYKYFWDGAVLICDHEIEAVSRIWFDKHLVYDRTGTGPISVASFFSGSGVKLSNNRNMRVYLGTETQEADPLIEAWCEDRYGPDSCPAYRGSAYIVFERVPVEQFGNRVPQITVEAVNNKSDAFPYESVARDRVMFNARFTPSFSRLLIVSSLLSRLNVWDIASRTLIVNTTLPTSINQDGIGVTEDGNFYGIAGSLGAQELWLLTPEGGGTMLASGIGLGTAADGCEYVGGLVCCYPFGFINDRTIHYDGVGLVANNSGLCGTHYIEDLDGNAWAIGRVSGNNVGIASMPAGAVQIIPTGVTGEACGMMNENGMFVVWQDGELMLIDPASWTVTDSVTVDSFSGDFQEVRTCFASCRAGTRSIWLKDKEYDCRDLALLRTVTLNNWVAEAVNNTVFDPINHALLSEATPNADFTWRFLDRIGSNGVTLKTVVDDVSEWCGLTGQDTTALTQTVLGYSVTQGSGKDMIAPLLDIHDVDARPHDFSVQFVNRGSAPSGTILTENFVRNGDRYTVTIQQDTDIPRRITFNFADNDKDQQTNTVIAQRPLDAVDSTREETIDLATYADTADGAQRKADRFFRRQWNSRERIANSLTAQYLALEPGDVKTLSLDGTTRNARLDKLTITKTWLVCEFVRDETAFATLNNATGPEMEGRDDETIFVPGPAKGFVIDAPLVEDVDNEANPIIYYLAGPYTGGFPGAVVVEGDALGEYDDIIAAVDSSQAATWGTANTALATASSVLWDRGNEVNVTLFSGSLTSATEAEINADPTLNLAAIGADERWEYIQFTTATLQGDGSYDISGLKRGRRGTEGNVGNHAIGDAFVLLDNRVSDERGVSDIGEDLTFKIQTAGRDIESAPAIEVTYDANVLKPYAPCAFKASKDPSSGDVTLTWVRRTRLGGAWTGGSTIPLSEASESYEVDIYLGATFKRTLSSSTPTVTYSAADQATDGTGSGFTGKLYQISAVVDRGFENSTTFAF